MSFIDHRRGVAWKRSLMAGAVIAGAGVLSLAVMSAIAAPASAGELTRSTDVAATASVV